MRRIIDIVDTLSTEPKNYSVDWKLAFYEFVFRNLFVFSQMNNVTHSEPGSVVSGTLRTS